MSLNHFIPSESKSSPAVAIFARAPTSGKVKTRLAPLLGPKGAAELQAALISDAIRKVSRLAPKVTLYFFLSGRHFPASRSISPFRLAWQQGADLGERLEKAFGRLLKRHRRAVVIGTDSPTMPLRTLRQALRELKLCDGVLGPCPDGGFYLIGLRRLAGTLFGGVCWGSAFAFRDTLRNLLRAGLSCSILEPIEDLDRPEDLRLLRRELARSLRAPRLAPATWRFLKKHC